jgi:hypothetical protein
MAITMACSMAQREVAVEPRSGLEILRICAVATVVTPWDLGYTGGPWLVPP